MKAYLQEVLEDRVKAKVQYCASGVIQVPFDKSKGSRSNSRGGRLTNTPGERKPASIGMS